MQFTVGGRLENRLTPADVGKRVTVRTVVPPGEGRVAGAQLTDTVGVLTSWRGGVLCVTRRNGEVVRLAESAVVAGKVVPPAPARRRGLPAASVAELTAVAARAWPPLVNERIGDWTARAAAGWTHRANSARRVGEGAPDLVRIYRWYAERGLPARLQVATGAAGADEPLADALDRRGWTASGATTIQVAALAPLADRAPDARVALRRELTDPWLSRCTLAARDPETARHVLGGGPSMWFATVEDGADGVLAVGRCVVDGRWAGFTATEVAPDHRRQGLATAVTAELARAALAEGASAAYLEVESDNTPARALYDRLGFADHHHYHYRSAPPQEIA